MEIFRDSPLRYLIEDDKERFRNDSGSLGGKPISVMHTSGFINIDCGRDMLIKVLESTCLKDKVES